MPLQPHNAVAELQFFENAWLGRHTAVAEQSPMG